MAEEWRPIPEWVGVYEVSSLGRIRSVPRTARIHAGAVRPVRGRILRLSVSADYLRFQASRDGRYSCLKVHMCVALAFLGPAPGVIGSRSDEYCVNHKNGDHFDNRSDNLEWATGLENRVHAGDMGLVTHGEEHHSAKLTVAGVREMRRRHAGGESQGALSRAFGVSQSRVSLIVRRIQWRHVQ